MTKRESFIKIIQEQIFDNEDTFIENYSDIWEDAHMYWEAFTSQDQNSDKPTFTESGKLIIKYLQGLPEGSPMKKAKDIAEDMFISSRVVSGAMRKLVNDGFVEKAGQNPVMYALTDKGKNITVEE